MGALDADDEPIGGDQGGVGRAVIEFATEEAGVLREHLAGDLPGDFLEFHAPRDSEELLEEGLPALGSHLAGLRDWNDEEVWFFCGNVVQ